MLVKRILLAAVSFGFACAVSAQGPSDLPKDANITSGVLPDGISYYIAVNGADKGHANFTLVQQGVDDEGFARDALTALPDFASPRPYEFLASKGISYGPRGYLHMEAGAAVYEFDNVPVYDRAASDSTLLLVFNIIRRSPAAQALIISGDVNAATCLQQLQLLSLSVPARTGLAESEIYQWNPSEVPEVRVFANRTENLARISMEYFWPRVSAEVMGSTRPLISRMFSAQMGNIISQRIKNAFRAALIPLGNVAVLNTDSSETSSDESCVITVDTSADRLEEALALISYNLANLDKSGPSQEEFLRAKKATALKRQSEALRTRVSNAEYSARCKAAYLYGASLASPSSVNSYFAKRNLPAEQERELLKNFSSAILSPSSNLRITVSTPSVQLSADELLHIFTSSWKPELGYEVPCGPSCAVPALKQKKSKLKNSITDPVTGGSVWTFANGLKVVFRQVKGSSGFDFSFVLRGGLPAIRSLGGGESAFVQDILAEALCSCGKLSADDASLSISGSAPSDSLSRVLESLAAFMASPQIAASDIEYFRRCEDLRVQAEENTPEMLRREVSVMAAPDYRFSPARNASGISDEIRTKVEDYLRSQFAKCEDGSLVIIGDLDPDKVKEQVGRVAGNFSTGRKAARYRESYPMESGWHTFSADASACGIIDPQSSVTVYTVSAMPFSLKNSMTLEVAKELLRVELSKVLASKGMYAVQQAQTDLYPNERVSLWIEIRPCEAGGLPSGIEPSGAPEALAAVRLALSRLSRGEFGASGLENAKTAVSSSFQYLSTDPEYQMEASRLRIAYGKNILSGYQSHLKSVSAADVVSLLKAMRDSLTIEYVNR